MTKTRDILPRHIQFRNGVLTWINRKDMSIFDVADNAGMSIEDFVYFLRDKMEHPQEIEERIALALGANNAEEVCSKKPPRIRLYQDKDLLPTIVSKKQYAFTMDEDTDTPKRSLDELEAICATNDRSYRTEAVYLSFKPHMRERDLNISALAKTCDISIPALSNYLRNGTNLAPHKVLEMIGVLKSIPLVKGEIYRSESFRDEIKTRIADSGESIYTVAASLKTSFWNFSQYLEKGKPLSDEARTTLFSLFDIPCSPDGKGVLSEYAQPEISVSHARTLLALSGCAERDDADMKVLNALREQYIYAAYHQNTEWIKEAKTALLNFYERIEMPMDGISAEQACANDCR